jgi:hypothetical protein
MYKVLSPFSGENGEIPKFIDCPFFLQTARAAESFQETPRHCPRASG